MDTSGGSGRARIDVTPMADVVIVLLLIFMVMTPALAAGGLRLPAARHGAGAPKPPALRLGLAGELRLGEGTWGPREYLVEKLGQALARLPPGERVVTLRADRGVSYLRVREALALCREAGAERVALATWPAGAGAPR